MTEWLEMFGLDIDRFIGSSYTSSSHHRPQPTMPSYQPQFSLSVGLINQQQVSEDTLKTPSLLTNTTLTPRDLNPDLTSRLATKPSSFGQGLLLSDLNGKALVSIVTSQGDVVQSVLASVLNASFILEASRGGKEDYYFLKETDTFSSDLGELQRLSGSYNVSTEAGIRNHAEAKILCARNRASSICVFYGLDKKVANRYAHKKAYKKAVDVAWSHEVNALRQGLTGLTREWTQGQASDLQSNGEVRGFVGVEIHNVNKYPQLIGQSSNIRFMPENEVQRNGRKRKN